MTQEPETAIQVTFRSLQEMGFSRKEAYRLVTVKNEYVTHFAGKRYAMKSELLELLEKQQNTTK